MKTVLIFIGVVILASVFGIGYVSGSRTTATGSDNPPSLRDYQIQLHMDTVWIYDGDRLVSRYINQWDTKLDSVILKDNL